VKLAIATVLFATATAHAGPRVANSEVEKDVPCVAWVDDKCVAHSDGNSDDDAKAAKPKTDAPAIVNDAKPNKKKAPPAGPKATAAIDSISSNDTVGNNRRVAEGGPTTMSVKDVRFELHGYARMPLNTQSKREPYLVDNDYFLSGFSYTRLYEPDWSELFFSARRGNYKVELGMFASLYSDYAGVRLENQLGIAQASVTAESFLEHEPLSIQLGVFWDRYGHIQPYDTYIYGRTHQGGVKLAYKLPGGGHAQGGIGFHQAQLQQNLGMTPLAHLATTYPVLPNLSLGGYYLRTWTRDERQLSPIQDGTMTVVGSDAKVKLPQGRGVAHVMFAHYRMDKVLYLAPALEVMHSTGGRGLTENFLGTDSNDGTGRMYTLAGDIPVRVTDKIGLRAFGMATWVRSDQVDEMDPLNNRDRRLYLKWGVEPSYRLLKQLQVGLRFDRVILDVYDSENSFRVASPKIGFPLDNWGEIYVQYSHYWYGDKVTLRPGQVPLETMPDRDVFKLQAQVVW
jgi:hypothetical protein